MARSRRGRNRWSRQWWRWPLTVGLAVAFASLVAATIPAGPGADPGRAAGPDPTTGDGYGSTGRGPSPAPWSPPSLLPRQARPTSSDPPATLTSSAARSVPAARVPATRPVPTTPSPVGTSAHPTHSPVADPPARRPSARSAAAAPALPPATPAEDHGQPGSGAPAAPNVGPYPGSAPAPNPYGPDEVTTGWTPRARYLVDQITARFSVRDCDGEADGTTTGHVTGSDHYSGNAADCFATSAGTIATGSGRNLGDAVAGWVVRNAAALKVKYVIWYGRIFDLQVSDPRWRPYCNAELSQDQCADPTPGDVATDQHYDHVHISVLH